MAGGTWTILVEQGKAKKPTQSSIVYGGNPKVKQSVYDGSNEGHATAKTISNIQRTLVFSAGIARTGINQYFTVTGQNARRNQLNATLTYGAVVASVGLQLIKGNVVGAAAVAIGGGVALANNFASFRRDIAESNATAEYLRQQSNTSISANRGDSYNFSLF